MKITFGGKIYCCKHCLTTKTNESAMQRSYRLRQVPEFVEDLDFLSHDSMADNWRAQRFQASQRIMDREDNHCTCGEMKKKKEKVMVNGKIELVVDENSNENRNFNYCAIHMSSKSNDYFVIQQANKNVATCWEQQYRDGFFVFSI